jgi:hypothetical protein
MALDLDGVATAVEARASKLDRSVEDSIVKTENLVSYQRFLVLLMQFEKNVFALPCGERLMLAESSTVMLVANQYET